MKNSKRWLVPIVLLSAAILIHIFSLNSVRVERYYTSGVYPYISAILKSLFGWLPFSFGDILYGLAAFLLIYTLIRLIIMLFKRQLTTQLIIISIRRIGVTVLWIYICFNFLWGINYNRTGIATQTGIKLEKYSMNDLLNVDSLLLQKVNISRMVLETQKQHIKTSADLRTKTIIAYHLAASKYPFLHADPLSLKPSLWGWLGNYLGFNGYYNPFTGEAQVNTTVPIFIQPFTFCHETAHQLGYAKENEANFVGYLAAKESADTAFHYSVYLDLFLYAQRSLYFADSASAKRFGKNLSPLVKADLAELRNFNEKHLNPFEPIVRWMYGKYLKNNQQPLGTQTYDEVVGYLIAFYKKNGSI